MSRKRKQSRPIERSDGTWRLGTGEISVYYPSGKSFSLSGSIVLGKVKSEDDLFVLYVVTDEGPIMVLDYRAVVRVGGIATYQPRVFRNYLPKWAQDWLDQNPEWASSIQQPEWAKKS